MPLLDMLKNGVEYFHTGLPTGVLVGDGGSSDPADSRVSLEQDACSQPNEERRDYLRNF